MVEITETSDWASVATGVTEAIALVAEPLCRRAADDIYERLLYTMQEYLADNLRFNIGAQIEAANRQALEDRKVLEMLKYNIRCYLSLTDKIDADERQGRDAGEEAYNALAEVRLNLPDAPI